jgi:hypothetical protein
VILPVVAARIMVAEDRTCGNQGGNLRESWLRASDRLDASGHRRRGSFRRGHGPRAGFPDWHAICVPAACCRDTSVERVRFF